MADEQEIASDESAAAKGSGGETGCTIWMGLNDAFPRCGRKLHRAPKGIDKKQVCLMHSKDPNKQSGRLFDKFRTEFERVLAEARKGEAHFERFVFPLLTFRGTFQAICNFNGATFTQDAKFFCAIFEQNAYFHGATFTQKADFRFATFTRDADFIGATFMQDADFYDATFGTFTQTADFTDATFTQKADLRRTKFHGTVDWSRSRFCDQAEFRHTEFMPRNDGVPSAIFPLAKFSKPGEIVFDEVDLSRVLFHNCDVSMVWFTSSAQWAKRDGDRGLAVFEESISLEQASPRGLQRDGRRDYQAVAQIYHQLKKNYDARLDYWTANEFHFGEMEMKRLAVHANGPLLGLRRRLHRRLSLVALYRYASDYGNSYTKPALWLLGILILFAALLPLPGVGLKRQGAGQAETYASVWRTGDGWTPNLWAEARLAGKGAITSVDAATYQKSAEYAPAYPWGRVLAIIETLLTSTLFALFLLAIRRQFRR